MLCKSEVSAKEESGILNMIGTHMNGLSHSKTKMIIMEMKPSMPSKEEAKDVSTVAKRDILPENARTKEPGRAKVMEEAKVRREDAGFVKDLIMLIVVLKGMAKEKETDKKEIGLKIKEAAKEAKRDEDGMDEEDIEVWMRRTRRMLQIPEVQPGHGRYAV